MSFLKDCYLGNHCRTPKCGKLHPTGHSHVQLNSSLLCIMRLCVKAQDGSCTYYPCIEPILWKFIEQNVDYTIQVVLRQRRWTRTFGQLIHKIQECKLFALPITPLFIEDVTTKLSFEELLLLANNNFDQLMDPKTNDLPLTWLQNESESRFISHIKARQLYYPILQSIAVDHLKRINGQYKDIEKEFSMPKGVIDSDEKSDDAATREAFEETSIPVSDFDDVTLVNESVQKTNTRYDYRCTLKPNSSFLQIPLGVTWRGQSADFYRETDHVKWVDVDQALNVTQFEIKSVLKSIFRQ